MNLFQIAEHIQSNDAAILFLRQHHILRWNPPSCPGKNGNPCGREMKECMAKKLLMLLKIC